MSCPARPNGKSTGWSDQSHLMGITQTLINRVEPGILPVRQRRVPGIPGAGGFRVPTPNKASPASVGIAAGLSIIALLLWALQLALLHDLTGSDAAGNALTQAYGAIAIILLWVLLAVLALMAFFKGAMPAAGGNRSSDPDSGLWRCRAQRTRTVAGSGAGSPSLAHHHSCAGAANRGGFLFLGTPAWHPCPRSGHLRRCDCLGLCPSPLHCSCAVPANARRRG